MTDLSFGSFYNHDLTFLKNVVLDGAGPDVLRLKVELRIGTCLTGDESDFPLIFVHP